MKKELVTKNKSSKPILDKEGNKIGEVKSITKEGKGCKSSKTVAHAEKVTKNGKTEMFCEEESFECSGESIFDDSEDPFVGG